MTAEDAGPGFLGVSLVRFGDVDAAGLDLFQGIFVVPELPLLDGPIVPLTKNSVSKSSVARILQFHRRRSAVHAFSLYQHVVPLLRPV